MSNSTEFLEGYFSVLRRFDGLILVFQAFFDETGGHTSHPVTAVAGFVYDEAGIKGFTDSWEPKVADLSKPYRTSSCNAGQEPFILPDWPEWRRQRLMDDLATISTDHALAGFVVATQKSDFEDACDNRGGPRRLDREQELISGIF